MVDFSKTDKELGRKVCEYLRELGVETPMNGFFNVPNKENVSDCVRKLLGEFGIDLTDDSMQQTPDRVAKMLINELFYGLSYDNFPKVTTIENKMEYNSMICENHIKVNSMCEHHLVVINGECSVAYIPNRRIIGLSKLNRIVDFFSRRPQVQERLTEQIFHTLCFLLGTDDVAVTIRAEHFCVKMRGVQDINSNTTTSRLGGEFYDGPLRSEYYQAISK